MGLNPSPRPPPRWRRGGTRIAGGVEGVDGFEAGADVPGVVGGALVGEDVALGVEAEAAGVLGAKPEAQLFDEVLHARRTSGRR